MAVVVVLNAAVANSRSHSSSSKRSSQTFTWSNEEFLEAAKDTAKVIVPLLGLGLAIGIIIHFSKAKRQKPNPPTPKKFRYLQKLNPAETWSFEYQNAVVLCEKASYMELFPNWNYKLQKIIDKNYGKKIGGISNFKIPDQALAISIPRKNFKCGKEPTDFEPRDQKPGTFTYEMYSSNLQITWFHYGSEVYLAGFCIYLLGFPYGFNEFRIEKAFKDGKPYEPIRKKEVEIRKQWCQHQNKSVILTNNQFGETDKFLFDDKENEMKRIKCQDCSWDTENRSEPPGKGAPGPAIPDAALQSLKVEFCEIEKRPVMISKDQMGVIKHFDWNSASGKFQVKYCKSCETSSKERFNVENDEPPTYEFLELIELVEE